MVAIDPKVKYARLALKSIRRCFTFAISSVLNPELHGRPLYNIWLDAAFADTLGEHRTRLKGFPDDMPTLVSHGRPRPYSF